MRSTGSRSADWEARPRWRLSRRGAIALGPGKADLLEAIAGTGSISAASRRLGMSYRRAWLLVSTMNRCFRRPLVATATWRGKGAWLTPEGVRALRLYRRIETGSLKAMATPLSELRSLLEPGRRGRIRS